MVAWVGAAAATSVANVVERWLLRACFSRSVSVFRVRVLPWMSEVPPVPELAAGQVLRVHLSLLDVVEMLGVATVAAAVQCLGSVMSPEVGTIVYTLSQREKFFGWVQVVYFDHGLGALVRGFVAPVGLSLTLWSEPGGAPRIRLGSYRPNGRAPKMGVRPKLKDSQAEGASPIYEVYGRHRVGFLEGVSLACDCRAYAEGLGAPRCCGACAHLVPEYLRQCGFLKLLWSVLATEADIMLCDEHCVHRSLCLARVLEDMTEAEVSYDAVGYHGCIHEVQGPQGERVPQWKCRYSALRGLGVQGIFERHSFSLGAVPGAGVYVDTSEVNAGGATWTAVPRAPGLVAPAWAVTVKSRRSRAAARRVRRQREP